MMNNKATYSNWVGVLLATILSGSAHFLAGERMKGIKWYFLLFACFFIAIILLSISGTLPFIASMAFGFVSIALWLIMLKQSYRPVRRIGFLGWISVLVLAVVLNNGLNLLVQQFVRPFRLPTGGMHPTIVANDFLTIERLSYRFGKPKRGDIIVFRTAGIESLPPDSYFIQRVAGLPGENIRIDPPFLIVDGKRLKTPEIFNTISSEVNGYKGFQFGGYMTKATDQFTLGSDEYFVLGDNSPNSRDSRYWGAVPENNIIGRATRIYWPLKRINALKDK